MSLEQKKEMNGEVICISKIDNYNNKKNQNVINNDQSAATVTGLNGHAASCQVCGIMGPIINPHYGAIAMACRACAAFFRRCIVRMRNKKYTCRCALKKLMEGIVERPIYNRIFCRACRLERCLEIGMRPEAVRAVHHRLFHDERRAITKLAAQNTNGQEQEQQLIVSVLPTRIPNLADSERSILSLLNPLLSLKERMHRISTSESLLSPQFYNKYQNLEALIECKENILDKYSTFSVKRPPYWHRELMLKSMEDMGFGYWNAPVSWGRLLQNYLLIVDMIKTIPVFSNLEMEDQKALLKDSVRKVSQLSMCYFSMDFSNEAIIWTNGVNLYEVFCAFGRHYKSDFVINLAYKIFINPMKLIARVQPSTEEFVLLLALLVTNPSASPACLSQNGKVLLNTAAQKYAKLLMQFEMTRFGQSRGPSRYIEVQTLLWNVISSTYKAHEMYAYFDTVLDKGCFTTLFSQLFSVNSC